MVGGQGSKEGQEGAKVQGLGKPQCLARFIAVVEKDRPRHKKHSKSSSRRPRTQLKQKHHA
jgi:hypothetical protein